MYNKTQPSVGILLWNHGSRDMVAKFMHFDNITLYQPLDSYKSDLRHPQKRFNPLDWNKRKVATLEDEPEEGKKRHGI